MRPRDRVERAFFAAVLAVAFGYFLITGHVWEDYYITYRHGWNLLHGHGLEYNPGDRVHGFTSPLGVLVPTLLTALTDRSDHVPGLMLFRALSALALAAAGLLVFRHLRAAGVRPAALAFAVLFLLDAKSVDNAVNGQETAFMLLATAGAFDVLWSGEDRWCARGLWWALWMWARPDGCVYVAVFALLTLVFDPAPWRAKLASLARSAAVCTLAYGPWTLFTWIYYGTPVPHTVRAKGFAKDSLLAHLMGAPGRFPAMARLCFTGPYGVNLFPESRLLHWQLAERLLEIAGTAGALYWLVPVRDTLGRAASLAFALLCAYFATLRAVFPWYLPPATLCGIVALSQGTARLAAALARRWPGDAVYRHAPRAATLALALLAVWQSVVLALTAGQARIQQREVEDGNRARIGRWLKEHVGPGERVYLEPLGYIGFFSECRMLDWPGLASPAVLAARRVEDDMVAVARALAPEWLVLRPGEERRFQRWDGFAGAYAPAATFDVRPALDAYRFVPGKEQLLYDAHFTVYRKVRAP